MIFFSHFLIAFRASPSPCVTSVDIPWASAMAGLGLDLIGGDVGEGDEEEVDVCSCGEAWGDARNCDASNFCYVSDRIVTFKVAAWQWVGITWGAPS